MTPPSRRPPVDPVDEMHGLEQVQTVTIVPFFADGSVALIDEDGNLCLPAGQVEAGEHYLVDTCRRVTLTTAGYHPQRLHEFGRDGAHLLLWAEGDRYQGSRPHRADAPLLVGTADDLVQFLRGRNQDSTAALVEAAAVSHRTQDDSSYFEDNLALLEPAYLAGDSAERGSGFGGTPEAWRRARGPLMEATAESGTFLDVGCANGLLMESVQAWGVERGLSLEPSGIDLAPGLIDLARRRLPQWADRLWVGNALDWVHPDGQRFDHVHLLLDAVPAARRGDLVRHHLAAVVRPGGRLIVSDYLPEGTRARPADAVLTDLGYEVAGRCRLPADRPEAPVQTAWLVAGTSPTPDGGLVVTVES